jgi:hypothetical protein
MAMSALTIAKLPGNKHTLLVSKPPFNASKVLKTTKLNLLACLIAQQ